MKRARHTNPEATARDETGEMEFLLTGGDDNTATTTSLVVRNVGSAGRFSDDDGGSTDRISCVVYLRPPVSFDDAQNTQLHVQYCGAAMTPTRHLLGVPLMPLPPTESPLRVLWEDTLEYYVYETHQVKVSLKDCVVEAVFVAVENNATEARRGALHNVYLQPAVDMMARCMPILTGERVHPLEWFPPNVDPAQYGIRVDPSTIPQRSPLWFKLRGQVSGTKAYTLLGYFVPNKDTAEAHDYAYDGGGGAKERFNAYSRANMRMGTLAEDYAIMTYLYAFGERHFYETGWCDAPAPCPRGWGAAPDGVLSDPHMTWDQVEGAVAAEYTPEMRAQIDITRGACEFKASRSKTTLDPYFLPQVYMEMISLGVVWCDLVRYRQLRVMDPETRAWHYEDQAHVYRIYRSPTLETQLMMLWRDAYSRRDQLPAVVAEEAFCEMRRQLKRLASHTTAYRVVRVADEPKLSDWFDNYREYRQSLMTPRPLAAQSASMPTKYSRVARATRQRADQLLSTIADDDDANAQKLQDMIVGQLADYSAWLQELRAPPPSSSLT